LPHPHPAGRAERRIALAAGIEVGERTVRPHPAEAVAAVRVRATAEEASKAQELEIALDLRRCALRRQDRRIERLAVAPREEEAGRPAKGEHDLARDRRIGAKVGA